MRALSVLYLLGAGYLLGMTVQRAYENAQGNTRDELASQNSLLRTQLWAERNRTQRLEQCPN
jgi:hypothetical protein